MKTGSFKRKQPDLDYIEPKIQKQLHIMIAVLT